MQKHDAFAALRYRDFSIVTINQFCLTLAILIQEIIVALFTLSNYQRPSNFRFNWTSRSHSIYCPIALGGYFADKFNKQVIMKICLFFSVPLPLVLWLLFHLHGLGHISVNFLSWGIYAVIFGLGTIRGFTTLLLYP